MPEYTKNRSLYTKLKKGDRVVDLTTKKVGKVMRIYKHNPRNPVEDHGFIYVEFEGGFEDHYTHHEWFKYLKKVD